jgi:sugar lactone lactonase YvrE
MIWAVLLATAAPALQPHIMVRIDPKHRLVEGVASDGGTIWVSSVLDRTIVACRRTCHEIAILPEGLHPLGIAWDEKRRRLWVAAECPKLPGVTPCDRGAVLALDQDGRIRERLSPSLGNFHPGDVSASAGRVFVSDSQNGTVYALTPSGKALSAIVLPGVGESAQGSVLDASGKRLIVADYSQGIASIDLKTGVRTLLPRPNGKPIRGIDGLARCGDRYFAIYNGGAAPSRLISFTVGAASIESGDVVEGLTFPDPTQLVVAGGQLMFISDAGWEQAAKPVAEPRKPAPVLALPLSAICKR